MIDYLLAGATPSEDFALPLQRTLNDPNQKDILRVLDRYEESVARLAALDAFLEPHQRIVYSKEDTEVEEPKVKQIPVKPDIPRRRATFMSRAAYMLVAERFGSDSEFADYLSRKYGGDGYLRRIERYLELYEQLIDDHPPGTDFGPNATKLQRLQRHFMDEMIEQVA